MVHARRNFLNEVLKHAYSRAEFDTKADMLIITDGDCEVEDRIVRTFTNFKNENAIDVRASVSVRSLRVSLASVTRFNS